MPGRPGDPAYDREHKGQTPAAPGSTPLPAPAPAKPNAAPTEDKAVGSDKVGS